MFAGAIFDPVNFVPFTFGAGRALSWINRATRIGAANAIIEGTTIAPLALAAKEARGLDYDYNDVALNLAFAFGAGFGLSSVADGARGAFRAARSQQIKVDKEVLDEVEKIKSPLDEGTVSTDVDLVSAKTLIGANRRTGTLDALDSNLLKNTNISNIAETPITVRTDGIVSQNIKDRGAKLYKEDNFLVVEGSSFDIVKILPTLQTRIDKNVFPQVLFKFTDTLDDEVIAFERLAQRTKLLEESTGRKAKLDETQVERTRVKIEKESFDIELDNAGKVKSVFNVKKANVQQSLKQLKQSKNYVH
jgi:hypothetical protein